jgi:hypothetical protein
MNRLLLIPKRKDSKALSREELVDLCISIDSVDTYRNVTRTTEICDLTEKTITPSNRRECNRLIRRESFLISKN